MLQKQIERLKVSLNRH